MNAQVSTAHSLLWLFPSYPLIGAVLNKLAVERVEAILIVPKHVRYWVSMLDNLPVVHSHDLGFHKVCTLWGLQSCLMARKHAQGTTDG